MNFKILLPISIIIFVLAIYAPKVFSHTQKPIKENSLTGNYVLTQKQALFHGQKISIPSPKESKIVAGVLGTSDNEKRIEIDLAKQTLYAYEGDEKIFEFLISSGKWGWTPTGEFTIWIKLRYTLMTGGSQALGTYYYLPNVPFVMFFYNENVSKSKGFSLHGTYWHDNFGHPMSHGCVTMKTEEVEQLFYWANPELPKGQWSVYANADNPGTKIIIYGETPNE
ncbi:MAG: L,D-transpeptidase [bacterium]